MSYSTHQIGLDDLQKFSESSSQDLQQVQQRLFANVRQAEDELIQTVQLIQQADLKAPAALRDYDIEAEEPSLEQKMANMPVEKRKGQYKKLKTLGRGAFGIVRLVRSAAHKLYAMKMIQVGAVDPEEVEDALKEVEVLESVHHPCVVGFKEAYLTKTRGTLCIVMT